MDFTLDTSGAVELWPRAPDGDRQHVLHWTDLDAFTQGTLTEAARELFERLIAKGFAEDEARNTVAFRNWSREALAMILADCAAVTSYYAGRGEGFGDLSAKSGRQFWEDRQHGNWKHLSKPPLLVSLGDGGKVHLTSERA